MEENKDVVAVRDIIVNIRSFLTFVRRRWWLFALAAVVGAALGLLYHKNAKPKYEAACTFILEEKSGSSGGLAGLASQMGINIGSLGSGGNLFSGDNILTILKSKKVVQEVLLSAAGRSGQDTSTLGDLYLDFSGLKARWQKNPLLATFRFSEMRQRRSALEDSVLNEIYETVVKNNLSTERVSKQGSIIKVQVTAENSLFARLLTERLVDAASRLYLEVKTGTGEANIRELQRRADSLLVLLNRKSYTAAAAQPLDINPALRTAVVPVEIATRDKTVLATLYAEVTKNLETSKLLLSQQAPVIQVLDVPGLALQDKRKGLLFTLVVSVFAACVLAFTACAILYFFKRLP